MNIVCDKETLLKALSISMNSIQERSTVETLKCYKLEARESEFIITSNNLETNMICKIKANVLMPGTALVNARTFYSIVSKLAHKEVSMYVSENNTLLIRNGQATFNIYTMNVLEFPVDMVLESEFREVQVKKVLLKEILQRVSFATSDDEEKVILNGVLVDLLGEEGRLRFVAADGYRLVKDEIALEVQEKYHTVIPIKTIRELLSVISVTSSDFIIMRFSASRVLFVCDEVQLYSRVINGTFPDYKLLIPEEGKLQIIINRKSFLEGCERINIIASKNAFMVKIELIEGFLVISSVTPDFGDGSEKIAVKTIGDLTIQVVFNVRLMMEALKNIETENIKIEIINEEKPLVVKEENNSDYIYIMMPIRMKHE